MPHKFDPENIALLDDPERGQWQSIEAFLKLLQPQAGMSYADIGCGVGYFTLPVAQRLGPGGKVYAVDIQPEMLQELMLRAQKQGVANVIPVLSSERRIPLPSSCVDVACLADTFHELEEPLAFLKEIRRILKRGGRFFLIDWKLITTPMGPPLSERVPIEKVLDTLSEAGFKHVYKHETYPYHYIVEIIKGRKLGDEELVPGFSSSR